MSEAKRSAALPGLDAYAPPDAPALDLLQRLRERLPAAFGRGSRPKVGDDRLERATRATVEDYVAVPDCRVVVTEIGAAVDEWLADDTPNSRILLVVLPPCDTRDLIGRLAEERGFEVPEPPARGALRAPAADADAAFDAHARAVLAVPRLERWFLRHRHGLAPVRALLAELAGTDRRCLLAVNSWGWHFLVSAVRAELILPPPVTPRAFDAPRLHEWFVALARDDDTAGVTIRAMEDNADVLAADDDGEPAHGFLGELASRARGIPWVAWQLWRRGLRTLPIGDEVDPETVKRELAEEARTPGAPRPSADDPRTESGRLEGAEGARREAAGDAHTLWVVHEPPLRLPAGHEHDACLVLQALLIHAGLTAEELEATLPIVGRSGIVRALERIGFVERCEVGFRCRPAAYPSIRDALGDAGYPLPPL